MRKLHDILPETVFSSLETFKPVTRQDLFCKFVPSDIHFCHFVMEMTSVKYMYRKHSCISRTRV